MLTGLLVVGYQGLLSPAGGSLLASTRLVEDGSQVLWGLCFGGPKTVVGSKLVDFVRTPPLLEQPPCPLTKTSF